MICSLCKFFCEKYTKHHLIPKTVHSNKWFKKRYNRVELNRKIPVCKDCHSSIHELIEEKELGRDFNTLEKLLSNEKIIRYLEWKNRRKCRE